MSDKCKTCKHWASHGWCNYGATGIPMKENDWCKWHSPLVSALNTRQPAEFAQAKGIIMGMIDALLYENEKLSNDKIARIAWQLNKAYDLLNAQQPKCKTCGGSKKVPALWGMTQMASSAAFSGKTKPCPACAEPGGRLVEALQLEAKALIGRIANLNSKLQQGYSSISAEEIQNIDFTRKKIEQAAARIEKLEKLIWDVHYLINTKKTHDASELIIEKLNPDALKRRKAALKEAK